MLYIFIDTAAICNKWYIWYIYLCISCIVMQIKITFFFFLLLCRKMTGIQLNTLMYIVWKDTTETKGRRGYSWGKIYFSLNFSSAVWILSLLMNYLLKNALKRSQWLLHSFNWHQVHTIFPALLGIGTKSRVCSKRTQILEEEMEDRIVSE